MKCIRLISACIAAFAFIGCTVGPNYAPPKTRLPAAFATAGPATRPAPATQPAVATRWWKTFGDPELDSLIRRAVESNLDLKLATARLREARARQAIAAGGIYPNLNAEAGYSHQRMSQTAQPFASVAGTGFNFPFEYDLYQVGFDASWELDIFGGTRRSVEAATADLAASIENRRAVLLSVMAEVARNYAELRGYQTELEVAERNLAVQRQTVDVTKNLLQQGVATDLDVSRAVAQAATTESQIPLLENMQWQSIHRLAILLGRDPDALAGELSRTQEIPVPADRIGVGIPAELLRRRPDIRRAERELAAASARVGEAEADLLPKFSLVGSLGLQSSQSNDLADWKSRYFNVGPSVSWPIFDAGRLNAMVHVRSAQQQQALMQYQQTVLNALREVEDAMVALHTERQRSQSLHESEQANAQSAQVAENLYRHGLTDFLTVLDAQHRLYESQDALVRSREAVTTDAIALYNALGGGWEE
jgi:NodT family efflux transporter outer membrane factor (OMF) lipoprotein